MRWTHSFQKRLSIYLGLPLSSIFRSVSNISSAIFDAISNIGNPFANIFAHA